MRDQVTKDALAELASMEARLAEAERRAVNAEQEVETLRRLGEADLARVARCREALERKDVVLRDIAVFVSGSKPLTLEDAAAIQVAVERGLQAGVDVPKGPE